MSANNNSKKIAAGIVVAIIIIIGFSSLSANDNDDSKINESLPKENNIEESQSIDKSDEAWNMVEAYNGKDGEGDSVITTLALLIDIAYSGEDILKNPSTEFGWISFHKTGEPDNIYEVHFTFKTYREDSEYIFYVNIVSGTVWPGNDGAEIILNTLDTFSDQEENTPSANTPDNPEIKSPDVTKDDSEFLVFITNRLDTFDITVVSIEVADGRINGGVKSIILSYTSEAKDIFDTEREIGLILASFFMVAEDGMDIDELMIIAGDTNGDAVGIYYCTKEWKESYISNNMQMSEVGQKVLDSFIEM
tara:strand:- start:466 stop:1383 length:918 start_codon:yes stop_codon:yes gene_type:complete